MPWGLYLFAWDSSRLHKACMQPSLSLPALCPCHPVKLHSRGTASHWTGEHFQIQASLLASWSWTFQHATQWGLKLLAVSISAAVLAAQTEAHSKQNSAFYPGGFHLNICSSCPPLRLDCYNLTVLYTSPHGINYIGFHSTGSVWGSTVYIC